MKTLLRFLFFGACVGLLAACSESPELSDDLEGVELKSAPGDEGAVFTVNPSGDDDTQALNEAFDAAVAAGHGSVVQLVAGEYKIGFIEIREFFGTFRGVGKGVTVITPVSELDFSALDVNLNTILIRFVGGDVSMNNMTIETPPGPLNPENPAFLNGLVGFSARTVLYTSEKDYIHVVVDKLELKGQKENTIYGLKMEYGILSTLTSPKWPLSPMDITITNSSFEGFYKNGVLIQHIKEGNITVGTKNNGNIFTNNSIGTGMQTASLGIWSNVSVKVLVRGNTINASSSPTYGIELYSSPQPAFLEQVPQTLQSVCIFEQNTFNISGSAAGMLTNDRRRVFFPDEMPMLVELKNNLFNMTDQGFGFICQNTYGTIVRNNKFTGSANCGVYAASPSLPNDNGLMLGNNFSNATFTSAAVTLATRARYWTIIGGDLGDIVINSGVDNLITGMNVSTSENPFGQNIADNLEELRDGIKSW